MRPPSVPNPRVESSTNSTKALRYAYQRFRSFVLRSTGEIGSLAPFLNPAFLRDTMQDRCRIVYIRPRQWILARAVGRVYSAARGFSGAIPPTAGIKVRMGGWVTTTPAKQNDQWHIPHLFAHTKTILKPSFPNILYIHIVFTFFICLGSTPVLYI